MHTICLAPEVVRTRGDGLPRCCGQVDALGVHFVVCPRTGLFARRGFVQVTREAVGPEGHFALCTLRFARSSHEDYGPFRTRDNGGTVGVPSYLMCEAVPNCTKVMSCCRPSWQMSYIRPRITSRELQHYKLVQP